MAVTGWPLYLRTLYSQAGKLDVNTQPSSPEMWNFCCRLSQPRSSSEWASPSRPSVTSRGSSRGHKHFSPQGACRGPTDTPGPRRRFRVELRASPARLSLPQRHSFCDSPSPLSPGIVLLHGEGHLHPGPQRLHRGPPGGHRHPGCSQVRPLRHLLGNLCCLLVVH